MLPLKISREQGWWSPLYPCVTHHLVPAKSRQIDVWDDYLLPKARVIALIIAIYPHSPWLTGGLHVHFFSLKLMKSHRDSVAQRANTFTKDLRSVPLNCTLKLVHGHFGLFVSREGLVSKKKEVTALTREIDLDHQEEVGLLLYKQLIRAFLGIQLPTCDYECVGTTTLAWGEYGDQGLRHSEYHLWIVSVSRRKCLMIWIWLLYILYILELRT